MSSSVTGSVTKTLAFNDYTVSAVALLWYDWCLTLAEEVEFVWKQKWTAGKWLYILNRYLPMLDLLILSISYSDVTLNHSVCKPWWHIDTWLSIIGFIIMDIVLLLRTWALWHRKRSILVILLVTLIIVSFATGGAALWASLNVIQTTSVDNVHPCSSDFPAVKPLYGIWAGLMFYDFVVMVLILIKAIPIFWTMPFSPTLQVFFRDGFLYYLIIFAASLANIFMITFAPPELATLLFTLHRSMSSLLGSRMILNLRGTIMRPSAFADLAYFHQHTTAHMGTGMSHGILDTTVRTTSDMELSELNQSRGDVAEIGVHANTVKWADDLDTAGWSAK